MERGRYATEPDKGNREIEREKRTREQIKTREKGAVEGRVVVANNETIQPTLLPRPSTVALLFFFLLSANKYRAVSTPAPTWRQVMRTRARAVILVLRCTSLELRSALYLKNAMP